MGRQLRPQARRRPGQGPRHLLRALGPGQGGQPMSRNPSLAAQEETRLALASAAARAERQNQPKALLYGAGLLLLAALIFLGLSFRSSVSAASDLRSLTT